MLNKVQIIGRLGQDPETVKEGIVRLNVATKEAWKDRESGERREKTEWHQVALFGKLADIATRYLHKGALVYVEGSLETRKYDKDGVTHYSTSIKGRELRMLDRRGEDGAGDHSGEESRTGGSSANGSRGDGSRGAAARNGGARSVGAPSGNARGEGASGAARSSAPASQPADDDDFLADVPF